MRGVLNRLKLDIKSRFKNKSFIIMFITTVIAPILVYFNIQATDLKTWGDLGNICLKFVSDPYILGFTIWNIVCLIYDPLSKGLGDNLKIDEVIEYEHIEDTM